jgi:hypothetical protein
MKCVKNEEGNPTKIHSTTNSIFTLAMKLEVKPVTLHYCFFSYSICAAKTESFNGQPINNRELFLTVLEAGKSNIKAPADSVSSEGLPSH